MNNKSLKKQHLYKCGPGSKAENRICKTEYWLGISKFQIKILKSKCELFQRKAELLIVLWQPISN